MEELKETCIDREDGTVGTHGGKIVTGGFVLKHIILGLLGRIVVLGDFVIVVGFSEEQVLDGVRRGALLLVQLL